MPHIYTGLDPETTARLRAGGPDSYGRAAERAVADGSGQPCRHCLNDIPKGAEMLILAHRPFPELQPYAEAGPIFLCADCAARAPGDMPPIVAEREEVLAKGYGADHRIRYGTGRVTAVAQLEARLEEIFSDPEVAFVDIRSAVNNCWFCRVTRDQGA